MKKAYSDAPSINPRVLFLLFIIIGCCVFLWGYLNTNARDTNAAERSGGEKTIITRPVELPNN